MVKTQSPKAAMLNAAAGHGPPTAPGCLRTGQERARGCNWVRVSPGSRVSSQPCSARAVLNSSPCQPLHSEFGASITYLWGKPTGGQSSPFTHSSHGGSAVTPLQATSRSLCPKPRGIPRKVQRKRIPVDCHRRRKTVSPNSPVLSAQLGRT